MATTVSVVAELVQTFSLAGWVIMTGKLMVIVVVAETDGSSTLVAVIV